ncbi:hypothetical protein R3P38DRAFT_817121 [Favolaschia claudopus]|uniref:Uncharacterized protein n=1 Tax=Favolaschia claudopus TaxID=2862362 RepID=A0AAW0BYV6_9AGAR
MLWLRHRTALISPLSWQWLALLLVILSVVPITQAAGSVNVSIANTSPQIVYTPFLCNVTAGVTSDNPDCSGGWNASSVSGIPTVTTRGAAPEGAELVPQMFLSFRASALYMFTSGVSNASANFTVTSSSLTLSRVVDTAVGLVAIVNLNETQLTSLTISFMPGQNASRLDIGSILVTVPDAQATSSFLPTLTLPPSISLPTFIPQTTTASSSSSPSPTSTPRSLSHRAQIAEALGLVLGLGVGLTLLAIVAFFWWKRRRRLRAEAQRENSWF